MTFGKRLGKSMVQMFGSMMKTERNFWNWRNNSPKLEITRCEELKLQFIG